jgi:superfamily II DNA or RNA helicase
MNDANRAVRQLVNGTVGTLVSTPIFRQGVDIPEIATVIQASGGKAVVDIIQKVGRGSRRHMKDGTTKDNFYVFDVLDRGCGCQGKQQHKGCQWLEKHSQERKQAYERFGYVVKTER